MTEVLIYVELYATPENVSCLLEEKQDVCKVTLQVYFPNCLVNYWLLSWLVTYNALWSCKMKLIFKNEIKLYWTSSNIYTFSCFRTLKIKGSQKYRYYLHGPMVITAFLVNDLNASVALLFRWRKSQHNLDSPQADVTLLLRQSKN